MERINYNNIAAPQTVEARVNALESEVARVGGIEGVCLTDALLSRRTIGSMMLRWLEIQDENARRAGTVYKWRLRMLRDEWGNAPKQGQVIERKINRRVLRADGAPMPQQEINDLRRRGQIGKWIDVRKFTVDADGCITCGLADALWFLSEYGVHWETREPLNGRRELSSGPCRAPDGQLKHVFNWRWEERHMLLDDLESQPVGKAKSK